MMVSRGGRAISFDETDVRPMGRVASGVRGMRLRGGDTVAALRVPRSGDDLLIVTERGYGKRTPVGEYPTKGRGTLGVLAVRITEERGPVTGALVVADGQDVMIITERGIVTRQAVADVRRTGRTTRGVLVQRLRDDDRVAAVALVRSSDDPDAEGGAGEADLELPADLVDVALESTPGEVVELEAGEDIGEAEETDDADEGDADELEAAGLAEELAELEEADVEGDTFDENADPGTLVDDAGEVVDVLDDALEDDDEG
jgi:DNA gyrase subunit A